MLKRSLPLLACILSSIFFNVYCSENDQSQSNFNKKRRTEYTTSYNISSSSSTPQSAFTTQVGSEGSSYDTLYFSLANMAEVQPDSLANPRRKRKTTNQKSTARDPNKPLQWVDESRTINRPVGATPRVESLDDMLRRANAAFATQHSATTSTTSSQTENTPITREFVQYPNLEAPKVPTKKTKKQTKQTRGSSAISPESSENVTDLTVDSPGTVQQQQQLTIERIKNNIFFSCFLGAYIERFRQASAVRGQTVSLEQSLADMNVHTLLELSSPLTLNAIQQLEAHINTLSLTHFTPRTFYIMMSFAKPHSSFVEDAQRMLRTLDDTYIFSVENSAHFPVTMNDMNAIIKDLLKQHSNIMKHLNVTAEGSGQYVIRNNLPLMRQVLQSSFLTYFFSGLKAYAYNLSQDKSPESIIPMIGGILRVSGIDRVILGREATEEEVYSIYTLPTTNIDAIIRELVFFDRRHEWYTLLTRALNDKFFAPNQISAIRSTLLLCSDLAQQALTEQKITQVRLKKLAELSQQKSFSTASNTATTSSSHQQPTRNQDVAEFFDQELLAEYGLDDSTLQTHMAQTTQDSAALPAQGQDLDMESFIDSFFS